MAKRHYSRFDPEKLILRDYLAADRTVLANERTFLAYVRTSLALLVAGFSLIKFFPSLRTLGWVFLPIAVIVQIIGIVRFFKMRRSLYKLSTAEEANSASDPNDPSTI